MDSLVTMSKISDGTNNNNNDNFFFLIDSKKF